MLCDKSNDCLYIGLICTNFGQKNIKKRRIFHFYCLSQNDQKRLESFKIWCWRRMEKISWTDHVRNEEVLLRVNEQRNILHEEMEGPTSS